MTEDRRARQRFSRWPARTQLIPTNGATRSTPGSSRRSATVATGKTGPKTSQPIAERPRTRITALLDDPELRRRTDCSTISSKACVANLNDSISRNNAIDMLSQHLITKPVFEALFEGYALCRPQPRLSGHGGHARHPRRAGLGDGDRDPREVLRLGRACAPKASTTPRASRRSSCELYEKFFKNAFPKTSDVPRDRLHARRDRRLHHSLRGRLAARRVRCLAQRRGRPRPRPLHRDRNLHRPAPAIGADQTPRICSASTPHELHANEILLLAYYIAAINIEATFHGLHDARTTTANTFRSTASSLPTPFRCTKTTTLLDRDDLRRATTSASSASKPPTSV